MVAVVTGLWNDDARRSSRRPALIWRPNCLLGRPISGYKCNIHIAQFSRRDSVYARLVREERVSLGSVECVRRVGLSDLREHFCSVPVCLSGLRSIHGGRKGSKEGRNETHDEGGRKEKHGDSDSVVLKRLSAAIRFQPLQCVGRYHFELPLYQCRGHEYLRGGESCCGATFDRAEPVFSRILLYIISRVRRWRVRSYKLLFQIITRYSRFPVAGVPRLRDEGEVDAGGE